MGVKILSIASELGTGARGAGLGVGALKAVSLDRKSNLFTRYPFIEIPSLNSRLFKGTTYPFALFIEPILLTERKICTTVFRTLSASHVPLLLTGDHSSAYGVIAGIKKTYPSKQLGVVWIDAHADLHSPYTTPSGNLHGMPLAMASHIDNKEAACNQLDDATITYWKRMRNVGTSLPKIRLSDVVYIATRDVEEQEKMLIKEHEPHLITAQQVRKKGPKVCAQSALSMLQHCDLIYVSFDVDSIDATFSKGTSTPVFKGLTLSEAESLNLELVKTPKLCAWDITEINPLNDVQNKMAKGVFPIVERVAQLIDEKHVK